MTECPIGWGFIIHQVHISDVNPAIIFKFSKRAISFFCETIDDRFQHVDGIIPGSASATRRYVTKVLFKIDFLGGLYN